MRRIPARRRFPVRPWQLKYAKAFKPKLAARAEKIINRLYGDGLIDKFQQYLFSAYPGFGSRSGEQGKDARFDTEADRKAFDRIVAKAAIPKWDADQITEDLTAQLFKAVSKHAFGKLGVDIAWNMESAAAVKAIEQRQNYIQDVGETQFTAIKDMIRNQVYTHAGNPVDSKFLAKLQATAGKSSQYEAERIARTETVSVQSQASFTVFSANGVAKKQWFTAGDDAVRDGHIELEGKIVDMNKPFSNGLMYPGDPAGGASQVCNCRCVMAPVVDGVLDPDEAVTE